MLLSKLNGILLLTCIFLQGFPQEQLGLRLGNYSGINGTMFNPAFNVSSPLSWDVNILAAGAFAENHYIFLKEASISKIIISQPGFKMAGSQNNEVVGSNNEIEYDFTTGDRRKEGYIYTFLTGPSAMFHIRQHTFGVFFNVRSVMSTNRVPPQLGYYEMDALETGAILHVEPLKAAVMAWSEVGLNYGRNILNRGKHVLHGGITLKFLQGYEGVFFHSHQSTDILIRVDSMTYESANVTYGMASGITGYGDASTPYELKPRGFGASGDIGVMYYIESENEKRNYDWKFGFSLLDFGKIAFTKNAQKHSIVTNQPFDFVQGEYNGVESFNEVFRVLSEQSLHNPDASLAGNRFGIWTPACVSFMAERAITNYLYINAAVVRRLRFKGEVPERDNIWAITPRIEHRWFEVNVPLVLYNDKKIRLGTAIRLGPLEIGTDNLSSWLGSHNVAGSDIYFALKINSVSKNDDRQQVHRGTKSSTGYGCYQF